MPELLGQIHLGEDYPFHIEYYDDSDALIAPDGAPTNSTSPSEPAITILDESDTAVIDGLQMPESSSGIYEYEWASGTDANGTGVYTVEIQATFNGLTDIERTKVRVD